MPQRPRKRQEGEPIPSGFQRRTTGKEANRARRWTEDDDAFLLSYCASMTDAQIAKALGRSRVGVLTRRLKVLSLQKAPPFTFWTEEEDVMLGALYGTVETIFLAAILSRPEESIRARAFYLRLRCRDAWLPEEDEILRQHYPCQPVNEFAELLPGRTDRNIYYRARKLSLERNGAYVLGSWRQRYHA